MRKRAATSKLIKIESLSEYELSVKNGYEPLLDIGFDMCIDIRIAAQNKIFGGSYLGQRNISQGNVKFYKWVWARKNQQCEECTRDLYNYSSAFVSHILSRKAEPIMRWDPRNTNILDVHHHKQWEDSPETMHIYTQNQVIIRKLQLEYNGRTLEKY